MANDSSYLMHHRDKSTSLAGEHLAACHGVHRHASSAMPTTMPSGLSVVICTHNGNDRLLQVLSTLEHQNITHTPNWEIIIVDNASTDNTRVRVDAYVRRAASIDIRITHEPCLGLAHARARGLQQARYDLVAFIDDDNFVAPDWVERAWRTMAQHPEIGACGGRNEAFFESEPPQWFASIREAFAVGEQGSPGDVTSTRGYLWGAGLVVRKGAWAELRARGYAPMLTDRAGARLTAGGDSELCFALRLTGWRLWYEPTLVLHHLMPRARLTWSYTRQLFRGFGASQVILTAYYTVLTELETHCVDRRRLAWFRHAAAQARATIVLLGQLARRRQQCGIEGDPRVLELEWHFGHLSELLRQRPDYYRLTQSLRSVSDAPLSSCEASRPC